jgi:hypothetical protein
VRPTLCIALAALLALCLGTGASAGTEIVQKGTLRVSFLGGIAPKRLPRVGSRAVSVRFGGKISTTDGSDPPPLEALELAINRNGHIDPGAVPACEVSEIQPSTTAYALSVCGASKVGHGTFAAAVSVPEQSPFPSTGTVTAFNGVQAGRPVILLHIYGTEPLPTSLTVPLTIGRGKGQFGTTLRGKLPSVEADVGFVTGISLQLERAGSRRRPYLAAGCPAPKGFSEALFPLARAGFVFAGAQKLHATLTETCRAWPAR